MRDTPRSNLPESDDQVLGKLKAQIQTSELLTLDMNGYIRQLEQRSNIPKELNALKLDQRSFNTILSNARLAESRFLDKKINVEKARTTLRDLEEWETHIREMINKKREHIRRLKRQPSTI